VVSIKSASGHVTLTCVFASGWICGSQSALQCVRGTKCRRTIFHAQVGPVHVDFSNAAPQAHGIVTVALHWEYSLGIIYFPKGGSTSIISKINTRNNSSSTTRVYESYIRKT
jgi:hypothetical protein